MTLISVVVPTHNRARTLPRAIASVLNQTHGDLELIVVDDGSKDDTPALMRGVGDQRLIFLRSEINKGGNWARNQGVQRATGEIVCFLDSDDEYLPHKLSFVAEFFGARPEVEVLVDSYEVRYPPEQARHPSPRSNPVIDDPDEFRRAIYRRRLYKSTGAISARRRAVLEAGAFDETLRRRQDMDLILRLARNHRCVSTDVPLWIKHWTPGAISSRHATFLAAAIEICERHPDYVTDPRHRAGLERDLGRHFLRLLRAGEYRLFIRDLRRYAAWGQLAVPAWRLMLGRALIRRPNHRKR